jgi:hypothetical protein
MSTYISTPPNWLQGYYDPGHSWEEQAGRRLVHQYGHARARAIVEGLDPATNADIAAWNGLGEGRAAA